MSPGEAIRLLLFLGIAASIYVVAGAMFVRFVLGKLRKRPAPKRTPAGLWTRRSVLALAAGGTGCGAWGYFVEPYWVEVTRVRIGTPKLPAGAPPFRLVHFSDLHCDAKVRAEDKLPHLIAEQRPDAIVFTGDCVNSPAGLPNFHRCMKRIADIAPVFACRGNWDNYFGPLDYFGPTGAVELDGSVQHVDHPAGRIAFAGVSPYDASALERTLGGVADDEFAVLLHHYPGLIYQASECAVDLHCAGHTHGGQVALPLYGALVTLSRYGKRFERGLYRVGPTHLYVNRGIGMEGRSAPRVRFCSRPEVTVIEIVGEGAPRGGGAVAPGSA
jgi:uncharacterized protein